MKDQKKTLEQSRDRSKRCRQKTEREVEEPTRKRLLLTKKPRP